MKRTFLTFLVYLVGGGIACYFTLKSIFNESAAYLTLLTTLTASGIILPRIFIGKIQLPKSECNPGFLVPPYRCYCLSERTVIRKVAGDKSRFFQCLECGETHNRSLGKEPHSIHTGDAR